MRFYLDIETRDGYLYIGTLKTIMPEYPITAVRATGNPGAGLMFPIGITSDLAKAITEDGAA